jgi:hypothetical protein
MADLQSRHTDIETRKRHDRLTVRKINDGEQDDNADADRNDVGDAGHAERDQRRQSRFRTIRH